MIELDEKYMIIDIETIPDENAEAPVFDESTVKIGNLKDKEKIAEKIAAAKKAHEEGLNKSMSLDSNYCRIVSLGYIIVDSSLQVLEEGVFFGEKDDDEILRDFSRVYVQYFPKLVGWNSKKFDIPIIWKRYIKHKMNPFVDVLTAADLCNPYRNNHNGAYSIDLMLLFNFGSMGSLADCCKYLDITAKSGMDGSMIYSAFKAGEYEKIQQYNEEDCRATLEVMRYLWNR